MVPLQLPQDLGPVCLPLRQGFLQGLEQLLGVSHIVAVLAQFLNEKPLLGDAPLAFGNVVLSLREGFSLLGSIRHRRVLVGFGSHGPASRMLCLQHPLGSHSGQN